MRVDAEVLFSSSSSITLCILLRTLLAVCHLSRLFSSLLSVDSQAHSWLRVFVQCQNKSVNYQQQLQGDTNHNSRQRSTADYKEENGNETIGLLGGQSIRGLGIPGDLQIHC